jgi:hypothetical protein
MGQLRQKVGENYMEAMDWKVALCTAAMAMRLDSEKLAASMGVGPRWYDLYDSYATSLEYIVSQRGDEEYEKELPQKGITKKHHRQRSQSKEVLQGGKPPRRHSSVIPLKYVSERAT